MADQTLTCNDCGSSFVFSESEQQFFADKGYTNAPGRCPDCRRERREGGGGGSSSRGRDRVMTDITCSTCGRILFYDPANEPPPPPPETPKKKAKAQPSPAEVETEPTPAQ